MLQSLLLLRCKPRRRRAGKLVAMRRRALLQLPALAGLAQTNSQGFKLSVRVEALFPKLTLPQQMEKVAQAGYQGFEFGAWRAADPNQIVRLQKKIGLEC